jgi:Mg2+/Co2+ transporter CorB
VLLLTLAFLSALVLSALFSGAEAALLSLGESRVRVVVDEGFRGSAALARLRSERARFLVLVRLGNALMNVVAALAAGYLAASLWGIPGLILGMAAAAVLIVVLGELLPMSLAVDRSLRIGLGVAPVLLVLFRILRPLLAILERVGRVTRIQPVDREGGLTEHEVRQITALGETEVTYLQSMRFASDQTARRVRRSRPGNSRSITAYFASSRGPECNWKAGSSMTTRAIRSISACSS